MPSELYSEELRPKSPQTIAQEAFKKGRLGAVRVFYNLCNKTTDKSRAKAPPWNAAAEAPLPEYKAIAMLQHAIATPTMPL